MLRLLPPARPTAVALAILLCLSGASFAADDDAQPAPPAAFDQALAQAAGADDMGMRQYVLVILKSGPTPVPAGPERDEMFRGHFANMKRLADAGKLVLAGPLDGVDGWRGLFILDVADVDEAHALAATDPVIKRGEMIAECHKFYGSAALRFVNETHKKIAKKSF